MYILRFRGGYYKQTSPYAPVMKIEATKLTRMQADRIRTQLRKLGYDDVVRVHLKGN